MVFMAKYRVTRNFDDLTIGQVVDLPEKLNELYNAAVRAGILVEEGSDGGGSAKAGDTGAKSVSGAGSKAGGENAAAVSAAGKPAAK